MQASLEVLSEFDTDAAASIRNVLHMRENEYRALLDQEGHAVITSRTAYMRQAIQNILVESIDWQFQALSKVLPLKMKVQS
jgi:hypothetical protein